MKKLIAFIITFSLVLSLSSPCLADTVFKEEDGIIKLTLQDAISNIEKQNTEIKLMDQKIAILEKQYKTALDNAEKAKTDTSTNIQSNINLRKTELLNWKKSQLTLENAKHDRDDKLNSLIQDIKKQYYEALMIKEDISNYQEEINNLNKNISIVNAKINVGKMKSSDLKNYETQKSQLEAQLWTSQKQLNIAFLNIKRILNIDINKQIDIEPVNIAVKTFDDSDIENKIKNTIENSYDIKKQALDLELSKLEYKIVDENSNKSSDEESENNYSTLLNLEASINTKEASLENAKTSLEANLWSSYNNLKNLEYNIEIEKLNLEIAQITYDITKASVSLNSSLSVDEISSHIALLKQQTKFQRAINQYVLSVESLENQLNK
ncbi:Outer membrane protein TolC [Caloramator quimbayensis]|uniref:Outer membrane protein TolC n=1 Tax=Caloramator quimbayensis TaxID=1147123 RepID=A0A1T4WH67_9CLOT|nr:TolC family protein [Caloramator quimbayensis]SKA76674.1 Outer membrane protein TolC [Caloramator quimbayensis]